ncbi:MAG TPA: hypothetical protein ENK99_07860 [Campylobacterales bacterium]|nr:hypothetical protein [Campylobacterales bacterium]HHH51436.1 hypothetical protein [Campylobacterales bacterium]
MSLIRDISTFLWLLIFYIFARYAVVDLDMPAFDMEHVVWAHNELFYLTTKDIFLIVGVFLLFIEIYKAATTGDYSISETIVSFFVSIAYLVLFLMWDKAHNSLFFVLMLMSFLDAIGGFVISINAARKDISIK